MKKQTKIFGIISLIASLAYGSLSATPIAENKLKVESGKMLFTLIKTMAGTDSKMAGLAKQITGNIDMKTKAFDFTMDITLESFALDGQYKFANDRMHETYLESDKFATANYKGTIVSYDTNTGKAKVSGKMTMHGTTKENVEIEGLVTKSASGSGYLLTASFQVNLNDYKITVPDIKLAKVSEIVELKMKVELRGAK